MATEVVFDDMLSALTQMYRAADYGADATSMSVTQLRNVADQLHANYNTAKTEWDALATLLGGTKARNALAEIIEPTPADVNAALSAIKTDTFAVLSAYLGSVYGTGSPAWSYSASLDGNDLIVGGHTETDITGSALTTFNGLCATLRTSLLELAPVA